MSTAHVPKHILTSSVIDYTEQLDQHTAKYPAWQAFEREGKGSFRCERIGFPRAQNPLSLPSRFPRGQNPLSLPIETPATQANGKRNQVVNYNTRIS